MHKHADVLAIVSATRPAQTSERIAKTLNAKRARSGLKAVSLSTVRAALALLREQGTVVRLTGDDAAACGAFPHQYGSRTAFWISAENYRSYHPGAELPEVETSPSRASTATTGHVPPREKAVSSITEGITAALDRVLSWAHGDVITLAALSEPTPDEQLLTRRLVQLIGHLDAARHAFVSENAEPDAPQGKPSPGSQSVQLPTFSAQ